jgi:AAA domain
MKLSKKTASKSHRVLLFGPPKSGKTELAGNVAENFDVILVDIENGSDTLLKLPEEWKERIEVISIPDTRSYPMGIETCLKLVKGGKVNVCEAHGKVSCAICKAKGFVTQDFEFNTLPLTTIVIWDSLTQLTNSAIAHITKNQPDDYKMQHDDWGNLGKLMDMFLSHIQNAPYNTICISHETEVEMEDGKNKLVPTAGTRNFSRNTAKYFDEVVYCEVKNKKHVAASSTTYANNILTGSRSGRVIENSGKASLIPIFKGELCPPPNSNVEVAEKPTTQLSGNSTPAETAMTSLQLLAQKMKGL